MLSLAPPERLAALPQFPGHEETAAQKTTRYTSIAHDIAVVAFDPREAPVDGGKNGRVNTIALLLSVSFFESGWAHDADIGPCYLGKDGKGPRCDGGKAATIFQIEVGAGTTQEGWDKAALFGDREKATRAALHRINRSIKACARFGAEARLRQYASGSCEKGIPESTARVQFARKILTRFPAPKFGEPAGPVPVAPPALPSPYAPSIEAPVVTIVPPVTYARAEVRR